ncbi:MAG: ChaN family lipoprotein [Nitrospirae bacterium]|nr:ChaN family lipoprotein [Nitrospirota bacterium]
MNSSTLKYILIVILLLILPRVSMAEKGMPFHALDVSFDIEKSLLRGISRITLPDGRETLIHTDNLNIISVKLNGKPIKPEIGNGTFGIKSETRSGHEKGSILEIVHEATFENDGRLDDTTNYGVVSKSVIGKKGIFLTGNWYPAIEGLSYYNLTVTLPEDYEAVSEAEEIKAEIKSGVREFSFKFPHPVDGISLIASRYKVVKESFRGIDIYAYFFPEDISLASTYLKYTKKYLELYEKLVGKYPYKRFSVVENFLPTGYAMPTFTLLGQDVVRLPFIVETSLGHEILHQWFGNLVYIDYEKGNWAEGLTTYLSDYLYEEQKGRGLEYRKQILIDYESYVTSGNEIPLKNFISRTDPASKAIGYGKGAMVFHMLKKIVGEERFYRSLKAFIGEKRFQKASWADIKRMFEEISGKDFGWFFRQWLDEKGALVLEIKNLKIKGKGAQWAAAFDIVQKGKPYILDIPVIIKTDRGEIKEVVRVNSEKKSFEIFTGGRPTEIILDEDYDVFRKPSSKEIPPVIARLLGDEKRLIVLPQKDGEIYSDMVELFKRKGFSVKEEKEVKEEDIKTSSLLVLGSENIIVKRLFGKIEYQPSGFIFMIKENPWNSLRVIAIACGDSKEEVNAAAKKIFHYGKYSMVAFKEGENIEKRIDKSERGLRMPLTGPVVGVAVAKILDMNEIINRVSDKKIIYVGEAHDRYEHHMVQLEVIKALYKKNPKIAVGMEMFQRPFQKALDDYIAGKMDEKEFLKSSQYFKRWGFDYNLYRDIIEFAREVKIPVVALNISREIVNKVSTAGLDSLTEEEKREMPESMDLTDEKYKNSLREVFKKHKGSENRNFDLFYQAQILWDETMAQSIDKFLRKNPDHQMVVLAGDGHMSFGSGIPKRAFRRNGFDYAIILNDTAPERDIADYILFPEQITLPSSPKFMVTLSEKDGKVKIEGFPKDSVSEKAGLKENDIIISLDDTRIGSIDDIKIFLLYKKQGDTVKVRVLRKRFLLGEKELEIVVTL